MLHSLLFTVRVSQLFFTGTHDCVKIIIDRFVYKVNVYLREDTTLNNDEQQNQIHTKLSEFIKKSPTNSLTAHGGMKMYGAPLLGIASADDPLFQEFRKPGVVGPDFILPQEWLQGAKSVISYFLPFTKEIRDTNRKPGLPSEEWVSARIDGEKFNNATRFFLIELLKGLHADAVAPCIDPRFQVVLRISNWSERHVAFAAGLGTFGLHRALITAKGSTGRIGSVVTTLELTPTKRNYIRYDEYCLYLTQGKCGACMRRCPPHAITEKGKDHQICGDYIDREILSRYAPRYGCAKCNISVPCEDRNPTA
jgi:epoxyqueuosine reductase